MDPFDRSNPLGPQGTLDAYRSALTAVEAGRTYSDLVATQQVLDLSGIDAGLAVTVAAHQEALRRQALEFDEAVQADYIQLVVDVDNLLSLLSAVETVNGAPNPSSHRWWQDVSAELSAIADAAGGAGVDADTAIDHATGVDRQVGKVGAKLDAALESAIAAVGVEGKAAAAEIDVLTKKISANIQAIVDGATATGDAFTALGIGILTLISKDAGGATPPKPDPAKPKAAGADAAPKPTTPDPKKDPATRNSDGKVPDVSFVVSAIKAGSKGTETYAAAIHELSSNNDRLAEQYQRLAAADQLVAVAKATQAQKNLFATSVTDAVVALTAIRDEWTRLRTTYSEWSQRTGPADPAEFARLFPGAQKQWGALHPEIARIKRVMTSVE